MMLPFTLELAMAGFSCTWQHKTVLGGQFSVGPSGGIDSIQHQTGIESDMRQFNRDQGLDDASRYLAMSWNPAGQPSAALGRIPEGLPLGQRL